MGQLKHWQECMKNIHLIQSLIELVRGTASPPFILLANMFINVSRSVSCQRIKNVYGFVYVETSKTSKPSLVLLLQPSPQHGHGKFNH